MTKDRNTPSTIITSHINADFDAVASMVAAARLYPGARIVFPGSGEKNLRDFFISSMRYLVSMADPGELNFSQVSTLVLVDTRQRRRVPAIHSLLEQKGLSIHIYDHHPAQEDDLDGEVMVIEETGATVTILTRLIRKKKLAITPDEATIMALGIYEDTGSFTYPSTTPEDLAAASFLLSCGAHLNTIARLISREIRTDQVTWLSRLLNEKITHTVNGVDIDISTISAPAYIPDLSTIVQKAMQIEQPDAFFAVVLMGPKITVIGRSRVAAVDAGKILTAMGGGGHASAASVNISEKSLAQAEQELLEILKKEVTEVSLARELMTSPPLIIHDDMPCRRAGLMMTRYNVNALLVTSGSPPEISGCITRQVIEKVLFHQLDDLPVKEYMSSDISTISPTAGLSEIQARLMDDKQRLLPVMQGKRPIGVITRTDLLNFLVGKNNDRDAARRGSPADDLPTRRRQITPLIREKLPENIRSLLEEIGRAGDEMGIHLFVVGGFVRDLLLDREGDDVDVVVEGDGIDFARRFAQRKKGRYHFYREFGTAVIILPDGFKIDVASARLEYYRAPAALPTVEMSSIKLDLFRRDFTINTLAVQLNRGSFGTLIDFFGGRRDLKDKTIRVLHNLSFVEDPTRVFRAIKFANRFDFTIGKLTRNLIRNAVKIDFFQKLSGRRVFSELRQILEEENPIPAVDTLREYQLERVLHRELVLDDTVMDTLEAARKAVSWHDLLFVDTPCLRWSVYFMVMIRKCPYRVAREITRRLRLSPTQTGIVLKGRFKAEERLYILENRFPPTHSGLYAVLHILKPEHILYVMACASSDQIRQAVSTYYTRLREMAPALQGRDLIQLGLKPGPQFQTILQAVLDEKLDGRLTSRDEEIDFVRERYLPRGREV